MQIRFPVPMRLLAGVMLLAGCASKPTQGGVALAMGKFAGDLQTAGPASPVGTPPAVRILDDAYNPVADVTVTFAVKSGGGTVSGATAVTDANGVARVGGWTLGANAGVNSLTATARDVVGSPATFIASVVVDGGGGKPPSNF
ncbi:MAG: hypothetical protein ABIZ70_12135 [Gemmatimonadales bacterium]